MYTLKDLRVGAVAGRETGQLDQEQRRLVLLIEAGDDVGRRVVEHHVDDARHHARERVGRVVERLAREHNLVASDSGREAEPSDLEPYGGLRVVRVNCGKRLALDADDATPYRLGEARDAAARPPREVRVGGEAVLAARELSHGEVDERARSVGSRVGVATTLGASARTTATRLSVSFPAPVPKRVVPPRAAISMRSERTPAL